MIFRIFLLSCLALTASACGQKRLPLGGDPSIQVVEMTGLPSPTSGDAEEAAPAYRIGVFDELVIEVFGIEEMKREVQVDGSGDITFPFAGRLTAKGLTPFELATEIADRLRGQYVRDPQVSVNLVKTVSQVVTVDGQVTEPGLYPVMGSMTLMQAVASARGTTEFAKLEDVVIHRSVEGQQYVALYNLAMIRRGGYEDPRVYPGDVVVVGDTPSRRLMRDIIAIGSLIATPVVAVIQRL